MAASNGLTKLQAVNAILETIGLNPVSALDSNYAYPGPTTVYNSSEAAKAERALDRTTHQVLARGYYFNTQRSKKYTAGGGNTIPLASDVLSVKGTGPSHYRNYDIRGSLLIDLDNYTTTITSGTDVFLDVVYAVPFEDCPPIIKDLIVSEASLVFQRRNRGSPEADQNLQGERAINEIVAPRNPVRNADQPINPTPLIPGTVGKAS